MRLSETTEATKRIQFSYYAYLSGPMGDVFQYLLKSGDYSTRTGKRMGLRAISAFWKPFSAREVLHASEAEVREIALNSIAELERQIELIKKTFNIQHGYLPTLTRQEIEQLIDARLNQHEIPKPKPLPKSVPIPDNFNQRECEQLI